MDNKQFAYLVEFCEAPAKHIQSAKHCLPLLALMKSDLGGYYFYLVTL